MVCGWDRGTGFGKQGRTFRNINRPDERGDPETCAKREIQLCDNENR